MARRGFWLSRAHADAQPRRPTQSWRDGGGQGVDHAGHALAALPRAQAPPRGKRGSAEMVRGPLHHRRRAGVRRRRRGPFRASQGSGRDHLVAGRGSRRRQALPRRRSGGASLDVHAIKKSQPGRAAPEVSQRPPRKIDPLNELRQRKYEAGHGDAEAFTRQHAKGKLTARERISRLVDRNSFEEIDLFARHPAGVPGDGVVTGMARIDGRDVMLFSHDASVFGGSLGEVFAEKVIKVMDLALSNRIPIIGINDSGGARIQEGVVSLAGYAEIFWRNVESSGVIPQISLVMGPCACGAVYSAAMTDFVLMVEGSSYMFITGADVVKTVTGEEVTFEELGGATTHATKSGVAHLTAPDEEAALEDARYLLSFLPQNNTQPTPFDEPSDPATREAPELDTLVPDEATKPYDIKK